MSLLLRDTRKIALLGPHAVGDFMFCLPALHALRHGYPEAEICYLGLAWHADFLAGRPGPVDRALAVPALAGMGAAACSAAEAGDFIDAMRAERFDLALQMHGGGRHANRLLAQCGARLTVGLRSADAAPLDRSLAYRGAVNRRLQLLEVAALAGAKAWPMKRQLETSAADRALAQRLIPRAAGERLVILQPGARDARGRWPAKRFAAVADALVEEGALLAINGNAGEAALVAEVREAMRHRAIDLSGKASLAALCGLLERAALVVANDSGPLHMALALDRPCVGIYWLTKLIESAPLWQGRHRAALSARQHCPLCGRENNASRCQHDVSFVDDVTLEEVTALAIDAFRALT